MLTDKITNFLGQFMAQRHLKAFLDVADENKRAHRGAELVVPVQLPLLVFNEVFGLDDFPDIVEVGPDPNEQRIRLYGLGGFLGEVPDDEAVVVGARRPDHELAKERMVLIGELKEFHVGR